MEDKTKQMITQFAKEISGDFNTESYIFLMKELEKHNIFLSDRCVEIFNSPGEALWCCESGGLGG